MGLSSVAIYSEADENSPHVRLADEAWCVGPAPAAESYLRAGRILEIAPLRDVAHAQVGRDEPLDVAGVGRVEPDPLRVSPDELRAASRVIGTEAFAEIVEEQPQHQDQRPLLRAGDAGQLRLFLVERAGAQPHHAHEREDGVRVDCVYVV